MLKVIRASLAALEETNIQTKTECSTRRRVGTHERRPRLFGVFHFVTDGLYLFAAGFSSRMREKERPRLPQGSRAATRKTAKFCSVFVIGV